MFAKFDIMVHKLPLTLTSHVLASLSLQLRTNTANTRATTQLDCVGKNSDTISSSIVNICGHGSTCSFQNFLKKPTSTSCDLWHRDFNS